MIREALSALTAALAAVTITACQPTEPTPTPVQQVVDAGVDSTTPTPVLDPLSSDGTWLVPTQIPHGTYLVTPDQGRRGYWALCADLMCEPGAGMITNDLVAGPGYVVIGPDAVAIELRRVTLTLAE
ncbi:hypothetical protein [Nocardia farcinica]|uniref:hypothetical protein n=1 Tax=Nocardia farcinica TaxID=37329 RepID=UPI0024543F77|nr:hypothetical protein [Nocardia farcinica]